MSQDRSSSLSRRDFVTLAASTAVACSSGGGDGDGSGGAGGSGGSGGMGLPPLENVPPPPDSLTADPFQVGVTSGDPLPDAVILWTRLAPEPLTDGGMPNEEVAVIWQVATTESFERVIAQGWENAKPEFAHTLHVDATGLEANTEYYYRFQVGDWTSRVGRTRTAPADGANVERLTVAVASCQDWRDGYYMAHRDIAEKRPDVVLFLGDYIYENGGTGVRDHATADEATDLAGYRSRYAQYRTDENLQASHAVAPWIVTWDDHEVDNNYAAQLPQTDAPFMGDFVARRAAAYRAFWEHMPLRVPPPVDGIDGLPIHRRIGWGRMADFLVGDTRQYRSDQPCDEGATAPCDEFGDPDWTMLGPEQETWLLDALRTSPAAWQVFVQSLIFTDISNGSDRLRHYDQWDGYPAQRQRIADVVKESDGNFLVVSGDRHAAVLGTVHEVVADADTPRIGAEITGNSISSDGHPNPFEAAFKAAWAGQPNIEYSFAERRGYALFEMTRDAVEVDFRIVEDVLVPESPVTTHTRFRIAAGTYEIETL